MNRRSKKPVLNRENTGRRGSLSRRKPRPARGRKDKLQRLTKTLDELVIRLQKTTVSKEHLKAEKAKLKKAAADLAREIAERKMAEEWTRRHEAHFRSMIESVKEHAIILLDHNGRIVSWNKGAALISGYETEEILGKHFSCFHPAEESEAGVALEILKTALSNGQWEGEGWRVRKDGSRFWASVVITAVRDTADRLLGFTNVTRDLTNRKQAEEAIKRAKEEAEAANQAKSDFLANISHEVRTPMTGIIGMAGLLAEADLPPKQREYCEIIRRSGESLLTVINEILDFSKAEAGKVELEVIDFDLRTVVEEVTGLFASEAAQKEIELISFVGYEVPTALRGDPGRLRQILSNLISNALKFTGTGEVVVRVSLAQETPALATIRFDVTDTGIGIPNDGIENLFNPFTQADASTTRKYGGTGLGLAICKKFVALMNGDIGVESASGKGSRFWFTVPLLKQHVLRPQTPRPLPQLAGLRALVMESNSTHCEVLGHYLDALGISFSCTSGSAAALGELHRAASNQAPYHLVILDFKRVVADGVELASRIRSDLAAAAPKLLLLTTVGKRGDAKLAEQAGFDAYLSKPVSLSCLSDSLALLMGEAPAAGSSSPLVTRHLVAEVKSQSRVRVLVADDNHINQKVVASLLENMGHRADVVSSGKEALEAFILVPYDVVLMDLQMRELNSSEACRRIRALATDTNRRTSIVAVTAHAMKGDKEKYLAAGFDAYVSKPIDPAELRWVIEKAHMGASTGTPTQPATMPGDSVLNLAEALARVEGNRDLLAKIARMFLELYPKLLEESHEAVVRADCELLARAARTIASSARQLGAGRVRSAAKKLEEFGRRGDLGQAVGALEALDTEIHLVRCVISDRSSPHYAWLRAEA
ncbi:MAG TPA: ATP-binding protein [Candidatus Binatia bacterium]|nr:ATP-binding protein [Candidatus Binatia bacterium]